jgi:hypothetical protein
MRRKVMWKQIPLFLAFGLLAACGGGGDSGGGTSPTLPGAVNNPPQIAGVPIGVAQVGQMYLFTPSATDADGDALTFRIDNRPEWATFSPTTGKLEGTPTSTSLSVYERVLISVSDGKSATELPAFSISVQGLTPPANTPPVISGAPATSVVAGNAYEFVPQAADPDGQTLAFSVAGKPTWASFDSVTGRLSGTPVAGDVGSHGPITISVSDGAASASLPSFSIAVNAGTPPGPSNQPPTISGTPVGSVAVGQAYSFTPAASDPDGQALTFSISNKPSWANFNTSTGRLSGTPAAGNVGTTSNIVITVTDGAASASLPAFTLTVVAANAAPTISGTPPTSVTAGQAYTFTPTASDPDGQALTFSISNKPSWANFNTSTGRLSGTPAAGSVGTTSNIVITVTDGAASASLPAFSITVNSAATPGTAELTWTRPSKNEDGSTLSDLAGYKVRYGLSANSLTQMVDVAGAAVTSASIEGLSTGTWYFSIASYTSAGVESAPTGTVYVTLP